MQFTSRIAGNGINCTLTPDRNLTGAVLCLSCMIPTDVNAGGQRITHTGGYTEIALPDLVAGQDHRIILHPEEPTFTPANRAWLPLGTYLRVEGDIIPLPAGDDGVRPAPIDPPAPFDGLRLVPKPSEWVPSNGTLYLTHLACDDLGFQAIDELARRRGLTPLLGDGPTVTLQQDPALGAEAYILDISEQGLTLTTNGAAGRIYGAITLLTLRETHGGQIPCGRITDSPRFGWRGQHLDCARHFYSVDTILKLLDLMALLKLNRFHWHFADDEAFRLELDSLPELKQTATRGENCVMPGVFGGGAQSGGSYSRDDVARILAHASALNIEVMPEIEVPAHSLALTRVYPETRDPDDRGQEQSIQGYFANAMNPAMPATWDILDRMIREIADLFPFDHLHLGCDELAPDTWMGSPAARDLMAREGLETSKDLQGWMMHRLAAKVRDLGKTPAAWEEAAQGKRGIEHNATLFSWTGQGPGLEAAELGYDVVMCPGQNAYLDMAHTGDLDDWGAKWAAFIPLPDTINWDPIPHNRPDLAKHIKGVQSTFWSEFTTSDDQIEPMIAPRILGPASIGWSPRGAMSSDDLLRLASHYRVFLDRIGWDSAGLGHANNP